MSLKVPTMEAGLVNASNNGRDGRTHTPLVEEAGETFSRLFNEVNQLQHSADQKIEEFATSSEKDIHGTMIAIQKADLSLRLFLQIRSKLTAAYQEIMRTQM